ncbi:MAG TPA: polysaccharide deacetylase family protein [Firmicutes bacterium]|nr:polysaccharide deacetylase family protein [Bacillota bacterium]
MLLVLVRKSTRRKLLMVALACLVLLAGGLLLRPMERFVSGRLRPIARVEVPSKAVALTFDIAFGENTPSLILETLNRHQVKGTFFVTGPWAVAHKQQIKDMITSKHEVGSMGYWFEDTRSLTRERIIDSVKRGSKAICDLTGKSPLLFRPPAGGYDDNVISAAMEIGQYTVTWSLDSMDWKNPGADVVIKRVVSGVRPGDIIRFVASDSSRQTHVALPAIILALREKGYEFLTVSELLKLSGS